MAKENKPLMRNRKGWFGWVHSYNNYIDNGSYDDVKWSKKTTAKEVTVDKMGNKTYKY